MYAAALCCVECRPTINDQIEVESVSASNDSVIAQSVSVLLIFMATIIVINSEKRANHPKNSFN